MGYLAGLEEKRRPQHSRLVGGRSSRPSTGSSPGTGRRQGRRSRDHSAEHYSEDFSDQAKCKQIALNQIEQGAGAIFQVAGGCGLGALDAAKEKGVWGIGIDADQSFLGPHILTSAVKRVDTAVFDAIKLVVDGKFKGGNITFGLKDNGVGSARSARRCRSPKSRR